METLFGEGGLPSQLADVGGTLVKKAIEAAHEARVYGPDDFYSDIDEQ